MGGGNLWGNVAGDHAAGSYVGATGALLANSNPLNMVAGVHNGAGDVTVAMGEAIAALDANVQITIRDALGGMCGFVWVDATHIQVLTFSAAAAAADRDFDIKVNRTSVG